MYVIVTSNFFVPQLEDLPLENMWFQQDGATCHTARGTLALLRKHFLGRVISVLVTRTSPRDHVI